MSAVVRVFDHRGSRFPMIRGRLRSTACRKVSTRSWRGTNGSASSVTASPFAPAGPPRSASRCRCSRRPSESAPTGHAHAGVVVPDGGARARRGVRDAEHSRPRASPAVGDRQPRVGAAGVPARGSAAPAGRAGRGGNAGGKSTLKAALDIWLSERGSANERTSGELLATVQRECDKMAARVAADVLAVTDAEGHIVASSGRLAASWPRGVIIEGRTSATAATDRSAGVGSGVYHVISVPLQLGESTIGSLELGTALDDAYARELADLSRGHAAIVRGPLVLASTLSGPEARDLATYLSEAVAVASTLTLAGESWAAQPLLRLGDVTFLALASIDAAASGQTRPRCGAWRGLAWARSCWPRSAASGWRAR